MQPISVPINQCARIRQLTAEGLTPEQIIARTGAPAKLVRAALKRRTADRPKSRALS
jgi:hypothetical protein